MATNTVIEISDFLAFVDINGEEALTSDKIEQLEHYIDCCNKKLLNSEDGQPLVEDSIYDALRDILRRVKPDSEMLGLWDRTAKVDERNKQDDMELLKKYPMYSINTIKSLDYDSLREFIDALPFGEDDTFDLFFALKENGHGIRIVYRNGYLDDATSRMRHSNGRNLTRVCRLILGDYNDRLKDIDFCEVRGELLLPFANLSKAREYNPSIKTAFTGVSSMSRDSATDEEIQLLDFVAYKFICEDVSFDTMEDEYNFLDSLNFITPLASVVPSVTKETVLDCMKGMIESFAEEMETYEYFTDGVVCSVDNKYIFEKMGRCPTGSKSYMLGNVALKVGYWKQDMYTGYVEYIEWRPGKSKLSPVAVVSDGSGDVDDKGIPLGVPTANGNRVRNVPLYTPLNILALEANIGNPICFRYGGESGVVPCYPNGELLVKDKVKDMLEEDDWDDSAEYECYYD